MLLRSLFILLYARIQACRSSLKPLVCPHTGLSGQLRQTCMPAYRLARPTPAALYVRIQACPANSGSLVCPHTGLPGQLRQPCMFAYRLARPTPAALYVRIQEAPAHSGSLVCSHTGDTCSTARYFRIASFRGKPLYLQLPVYIKE